MEFMNGLSTGDYLHRFRRGINMTSQEVTIITGKIVKALVAFKEMGIAHRDLHNGQILIHYKNLDQVSDIEQLRRRVKRKQLLALNNPEDFDVKVADFGRAKQV